MTLATSAYVVGIPTSTSGISSIRTGSMSFLSAADAGSAGMRPAGWTPSSVVGRLAVSSLFEADCLSARLREHPPHSLALDSFAAFNKAVPIALRERIHDSGSGSSATIQFFADPETASDALRYPRHGEVGNRNVLRGPRFWNVDTALLKNFRMPWSEAHKLVFRWESYNLFNNHVFALAGRFHRIANVRADHWFI